MSKAAKRAIPAAALAAVGLAVILAFAGVVAAAPATPWPAGTTAALGDSAAPYGWVVQLRGAISRDLTYTQFAALQKTVGATWTDGGSNKWAGIPLWRLVGLVDDKHPKTFNRALAAKGYSVQVIGLDGSTANLKSTDDSWVRNNTAIVADKENGAWLSFGSLSSDDPPKWLPSWPARLVGKSLESGQQTGGVVKIIVYKHGATVPAKPAIQPSWIVQVRGATSVDYTAAQFRRLAKAHGATWKDTSVTPNVSYAGTPLWRLVALVDGGSPATLNLDRVGLGYNVDVIGMGAGAAGENAPTTATFAASAIADKSSVIIADRRDGRQLTPTQGKAVQQTDLSYLWQPTWPARIVGTGVTTDRSNGGLLRVVVHKPVVPSYVKPLVLQGRRTVRIAYLDFPTNATWDGVISTNARALYRGQTLYKLIGLVDDGHPKTFNATLARKGYEIKFIASDTYRWTISSRSIIGKKRWIVASLKDGAVMSSDEGPYRYVGSFIKPFYGKPSVYKLIRIKLIF